MPNLSSRSWYDAPISDFIKSGPGAVLGQLLENSTHEIEMTQRDAWLAQYHLLASAVKPLSGHIFWEFSIPRMGRRVDVLILNKSSLIVIEFKVGQKEFTKDAIYQVWDYALDIKNFHQTSHDLTIFPVLIATEATHCHPRKWIADHDNVYRPLTCGKNQIQETLCEIINKPTETLLLSATQWMRGSYKPTPTIIEAARSLYSQHSVEDIARSDAGAKNLSETSSRIEVLAQRAHQQERKIICFVTGVPGAGKTLVGLNVANKHRKSSDHAVFLSGNGPLVAVLREALTRDEYQRKRKRGEKVRKGRVAEGVKSFIQNIHHFRDEALIDPNPPADHIVIFDEAQRAWNHVQTANFMLRKKNHPDFSYSEPEFLLQYMNRHKTWTMVVCLVGGGQEINTGEAGIDAWLDAVTNFFPSWEMYISNRLTDSEYSSKKVQQIISYRPQTFVDNSLHLGISMRSFRAENLSAMVKAILDCNQIAAEQQFSEIKHKYPLVITRNLDKAKSWLRRMSRGSERYGLLSSSKAMRLKPHAIDIRVSVDPTIWFLNDRSDIRSSFYLEDVATEFQVQGLELDWTCVAWDGDLRFSHDGWKYHDFRGNKWQNIHSLERQQYLKNAYRVLLTRARQGMVIFVPPGDGKDSTRLPQYYDPIYEYLRKVGIPELT